MLLSNSGVLGEEVELSVHGRSQRLGHSRSANATGM